MTIDFAASPNRTNPFRAFKSLLLIFMTVLAVSTYAPLNAQDEDGGESGGSNLVTIGMNGGAIESAAAVLSASIDGTVNIYGKAAGLRVTVLAEDQPIETVLGMICNPNGLTWWEENGDYGISDRQYFEQNILPKRVVERVFRPNNIKAGDLNEAIQNLLTPNVGSSIADERTNKLIVNDLPQILTKIEEFIRQIDVQNIIRVFYIRHANVEEIAQKIENYKSEPGTIEIDTKTHQIIVTDQLSNIKKMELLIDILDVGPEIVIYDVNNIGIEGEQLEALQSIIESIKTEDETLLFEVNQDQGVFILEDVPEVHERVEQLLEGFDQPVKQVLLQGEILTTSFNRQFDIGLKQFAIADDLFEASRQSAVGPNFGFGGGDGSGGNLPDLSNFVDLEDIFPSFSLVGSTLTANQLTQNALMQFQSVYSDTSTRVLLQPRLLVKNQETSRIFVGEEEPFLTTFFDDSTNGNNRRTTSQSTVTSGLTFEVTVSISNSYLVELDLSIDNDKAVPEDIPTGQGDNVQRVVGRERQQVETILQVPSGQTRMIGGLITNDNSDGNSGVPFLSSLPIIGPLFGFRSSTDRSSNLMIFLTPSVVEDNLPRPTSEDGRRGRLVTDYERVPGEFDLGLEEDRVDDENNTGEDPLSAPELMEDLLSGDSEMEEDLLRQIEEARRRRTQEAQDSSEMGNYVPSIGSGSATLNRGNRTGETGRGPSGRPPSNQIPNQREPIQVQPPPNSSAPVIVPSRETTYR